MTRKTFIWAIFASDGQTYRIIVKTHHFHTVSKALTLTRRAAFTAFSYRYPKLEILSATMSVK